MQTMLLEMRHSTRRSAALAARVGAMDHMADKAATVVTPRL